MRVIDWVFSVLVVLIFIVLFVSPALYYHNGKAFWNQDDIFSRGSATSATGKSDLVKTNGSGGGTTPTGGCRVINDYGLELKPEVATSGSHLHVEYWTDGQPERETMIPASAASGGRFILTQALKGHVWEYADCTDAEVMAQIQANILRRRAGGANNAGFVDWTTTGLFRPAGGGSSQAAPSNAPPPPVSQPSGTKQVQPSQQSNTAQAPPAPAPAQPAPAQAPQAQAPQAQACGDGVRGTDFTPQNGVNWNPGSAGDWRVVNFWTNWPGQPQGDRKVLLAPGDPGNLPGGGSYWSWPASCGEAAQKAYNANSFAPLR